MTSEPQTAAPLSAEWLTIRQTHALPKDHPGYWSCVCGMAWPGEARAYPDDIRDHALFRVQAGEPGRDHDPGLARFRPDSREAATRARSGLDAEAGDRHLSCLGCGAAGDDGPIFCGTHGDWLCDRCANAIKDEASNRYWYERMVGRTSSGEAAPTTDRILIPTRLLRTEWPPTPQLVPGGSERFDAVYESLRAGESIREPLLVRQDNWTIIDGCHRLQAARLLGIATVPVRFWTGAEWLPSGEAAPTTCPSCGHARDAHLTAGCRHEDCWDDYAGESKCGEEWSGEAAPVDGLRAEE